MKAEKVSKKKLLKVIDERKPLGLFYRKDGDRYVAVDNTDGYAWTEEFLTEGEAIAWLEMT